MQSKLPLDLTKHKDHASKSYPPRWSHRTLRPPPDWSLRIHSCIRLTPSPNQPDPYLCDQCASNNSENIRWIFQQYLNHHRPWFSPNRHQSSLSPVNKDHWFIYTQNITIPLCLIIHVIFILFHFQTISIKILLTILFLWDYFVIQTTD